MRVLGIKGNLVRAAASLGATVHFEPEYELVGMLRFPNGKHSFFWENKFSLNPVGAARMAQDKGYTRYFLHALGFPVPDEQSFLNARLIPHIPNARTIDQAPTYARSLGYPVFVKPCRRSQGSGIVQAHTDAELLAALSVLLREEDAALVQRSYPGQDLRVVVLDGRVLVACVRAPLTVLGDGRSSVRALLNAQQRAFERAGRDTKIPVGDPRIDRALRRAGLTLDAVLPADEPRVLLEVSNVSLGGRATDVTHTLPDALRALAIAVAGAMELRFCGVDLLYDGVNSVVLEVNSAPGLDYYLLEGDANERLVDGLYARVLEALMWGPGLSARAAERP